MTHSHPARVELQQFLNDAPISRFQWGIFILCFLVALIDGYDTAAIGYIGPSILAEWDLEKAALAPAMSAGLLGIALGAIFLAPWLTDLGGKMSSSSRCSFLRLAPSSPPTPLRSNF